MSLPPDSVTVPYGRERAMSYPADAEVVPKPKKELRKTEILEEFNVPCPTCGSLCNSTKKTVTEGKMGGSSAVFVPVYTPVTNP